MTKETMLPVSSAPPIKPAESTPAPAFDYRGINTEVEKTLRCAENMIRTARKEYVVRVADAVEMAHDALVRCENCYPPGGEVVHNVDNSKHGNRGEETFLAWCASVSIGKTTAYKLLQVSEFLRGSTPEEQSVLKNAQPSLLYAAARPSAPAELVEQVKSGDITTHKKYQELLAELKAKDNTIQEKDAALLKARQAADLAQTTANIYEAQKKGAEEQCLALIDENEAQSARIKELESRPIEATAATEEEIDRWRREGAAEEAQAASETIQNLRAERDYHRSRAETAEKAAAAAQKAEEKAEKAQREAKRLRETLQGRTDHLEAVEAELKALKQRIAGAQNALPRLPDPHTTMPPPAAQTPPALTLCKQCVYEPICCGIHFLDEDDMSEEMYAGFMELDEDAFDARLVGCTAGQTKESR